MSPRIMSTQPTETVPAAGLRAQDSKLRSKLSKTLCAFVFWLQINPEQQESEHEPESAVSICMEVQQDHLPVDFESMMMDSAIPNHLLAAAEVSEICL